jgi:hypothetical protein
MKKNVLFFALLVLSVIAFAQTGTSQRSSVSAKEKVVPFLMGTGQTTGGVFLFKFDFPIEMEYSVVLTPLSENTNLYIADKTAEGFSVKTANSGESSFDFIVFIKKKNPISEKTE